MTVVVGRPIGGVSLNGLEFLLDGPNGNYMEFKDKEAAKEFLREHAFPDATNEELEDYCTFMSPEEAKAHEDQVVKDFPSFKHGEMKINLFFKEGIDVAGVADAILDMHKGFTAFNHATEHHLVDGRELHVSKNQDLNIFTDFKTFITVDPLSDVGENTAAAIISIIAIHEDFTHMDTNPLVLNK